MTLKTHLSTGLLSAAFALSAHGQQGRLVFDPTLVARNGQSDIVSIDPEVSIGDTSVTGDAGVVGFIGRRPNGEGGTFDNIYAWRPQVGLVNLTPGLDGSNRRSLGPSVQTNAQGQILYRKLEFIPTPFGEDPVTVIARIDAATAISTTIVTGELFFGDFDGLYTYPSINNGNGIVFAALDGSQNYLATLTSAGGFFVALNSELPRPMMSDTNRFVMRLGTSSIALLQPAFFPIVTIAGVSQGYEVLGRRPGISDNGRAIAFAGQLNGRAVFAAFSNDGASFGAPIRLTGTPGNGVLEAGETYDDLNLNEMFDPSIGEIDEGGFLDIEMDERVGINSFAPEPGRYLAVFSGRDAEGRRGIFAIQLNPSKPAELVERTGPVVREGDSIDELGIVDRFRIHDPVNQQGQVALWAGAGGAEGVVVADPQVGVTAVDFNNELFRQEDISENDLLYGGDEVIGLAADGVTQILLKTPAFPGPGSIQIRVEDEFGNFAPDDVGRLRNLLGAEEGQQMIIRLRRIPNHIEEWRAFVVWTAPRDFVRSSRRAEDEKRGFQDPRRLYIRTHYLPDDGEFPEPVRTSFRLDRPPVVLIHGLEDYPKSWKWPLVSDQRFVVELANYGCDSGIIDDILCAHARPFLTNVRVPQQSIAAAIERMRSRGIAATQADVFGHSMGGILARLYAMDTVAGFPTHFLRDDNFHQGDIHKLVTVNTPHRGSPLAVLAVNADNSLGPLGLVGVFFTLANQRCDLCGAARDLRPDSEILRVINSAHVNIPVHAIYGSGGLVNPFHSYNIRTLLFLMLPCLYTQQSLFGGPNDAVVSVVSQCGGLPDDNCSEITGDCGLHFPIINECPSGASSARAIELLHEPISSAVFADGFPVYNSPPVMPGPCLTDPLFIGTGWFGWVNPLPDIEVPAGSTIPFEVTPLRGFTPETIIVECTSGDRVVLPAGVLEGEIQISEEHVGHLELRVYAIDADARISGPDPVAIYVAPVGELESLRTETTRLDFGPRNRQQRLLVKGRYSKSGEHDVSNPIFGTTYESSNESVVWAEDGNRLRPIGVGRAVITVRNGELSATCEVRVTGLPGDIDRDGAVGPSDADALEACFTGRIGTPGFIPPDIECSAYFDFDEDGDIDCADSKAFTSLWSGPGPAPTIPQCTCRGDFNGDGSLNSQDFFDFLAAFFNSSPEADVNGDGFTNSQDFFDFLAAFFGGC